MPRDWKGGNASTFKTIGASNHCEHDRADRDYYATEPTATEWLTRIERFDGPILEPSCGEGHISRVLMAAGYEVTSRDIADRGFGEVADFLSPENTGGSATAYGWFVWQKGWKGKPEIGWFN